MLTTAQLQTLKADILADPAFASIPNNDDGNFAIAAVYNALASPAWRVWKTSVTTSECKDAINWTEYIMALAKRDATRAEKLFSTGTGSDATPATMTFEGSLSYSDVSAARNSDG